MTVNPNDIPDNGFFDESDDEEIINQNKAKGSNTIKDPDEWTTGDEPMTGAQHSYLKTLSDEAGEEFDESLTKAEASKRIDDLQHKTGRGLNN
ncbi:DUF3072 domain-containing protein [Mucilaginibacter endophyticus]|uniref:DUF3072 domain-containing protein n=1 Tax=Mucilaginibacter endophyticus TaxID=2675003 RepID=UPI001FC9AC6B|nr:DUF3072 domain-containing protein [Mucilaginibacter endophyticus]